MKVICGVLILCSIQMGCSSSYVVSSSPNTDPSFNTFNVYAHDRSATILFQDSTKVDARNITASPDSTRFLSEKSDSSAVVPTQTITKIVFTNRGIGFLKGFGWGAGVGVLAGSVTGLVAGGSSSEHSFGWGADMATITLALGAVGGAAGGVIGGITGLIHGQSYEFQFVTSADSTRK